MVVRVLTVNVGRPRPNPWKGIKSTGIDKRPVEGPVAVTAPGPKGDGAVGLAGDRPDHDVTVAMTFRGLMLEPELAPRLLAATALPAETLDDLRLIALRTTTSR